MSNSKIKIKKNKKNGKSLKQLHKALSGLLQKDNKPQKKDVSIDKSIARGKTHANAEVKMIQIRK